MNTKQTIGLIISAIIIIFLILSIGNLFETVDKGTYHIIQAPVSGDITVIMKPGMYFQKWADVSIWNVSETFYFTSDSLEGEKADQSIKVRFNDGSTANISGTCRVMLPTSPEEAKDIMTKYGFRSYRDLESKFIRPIVRNAMRLTANLMSARQSYAERRNDFISWTWDQVQFGIYQTEDETITTIDPITRKETTKVIKIIKRDASGTPLRAKNPLEGTGITLANFEIKDFVYSDRVKQQITKQQEALMGIATARAEAEKAEQDAKTQEAKGKAEVMKVKYLELKEKEKAIVQAQKEKEVAELQAEKKVSVAKKNKEEALVQAEKEKEVAKLQKEAAKEIKEKLTLEGQGEAEKKKLIMQADGALQQKLSAWVDAQKVWADALKYRKVPSVVMGGSGENGELAGSAQDFINLMMLKSAKDLSLDMNVKGSE